ncbi:transposase [Streptomyces sp. NPDC019443]|uniref:transposase n=1 Tax=Streptomyces sp. NPDC019443 TaxID=3365061 RepID=UPI0037BB79E7
MTGRQPPYCGTAGQEIDSEREGREAEPSAGIIDAQSVRAAASVPAASRATTAGRKVAGRKRHIVTDCLGLLLVVAVTAANIGDPADTIAAAPSLRARGAVAGGHLDVVAAWTIPADARQIHELVQEQTGWGPYPRVRGAVEIRREAKAVVGTIPAGAGNV